MQKCLRLQALTRKIFTTEELHNIFAVERLWQSNFENCIIQQKVVNVTDRGSLNLKLSAYSSKLFCLGTPKQLMIPLVQRLESEDLLQAKNFGLFT